MEISYIKIVNKKKEHQNNINGNYRDSKTKHNLLF